MKLPIFGAQTFDESQLDLYNGFKERNPRDKNNVQ
jgi:hypothetical protein